MLFFKIALRSVFCVYVQNHCVFSESVLVVVTGFRHDSLTVKLIQ